MKTLARILVSTTLLLLAAASSSPLFAEEPRGGNTVVVDCDGAADFTTIQAAINAAVSGDTIVIAPNDCNLQGRYFERLNLLGKSLRLQSIDPDDPAVVDDTVIDGMTGGDTITALAMPPGATPTEIAGLTVLNGTNVFDILNASLTLTNLVVAGSNDRGITAEATPITRSLSIVDCVIRDTRGIGVDGYDLKIRGTQIIDNDFTGLSVFDSKAEILDTNFERNGPGGPGGGIYLIATAATLISNCRFIANVANIQGGGAEIAYLSGGVPAFPIVVRDCLFAGNRAFSGGGVKLWGQSVTADHCTFVGNRATQGPAIYVFSSGSVVTNCICWNNRGTQSFTEPDIAANGSYVRAYNDLQFASPFGVGNISADPMFVDPGVWDAHGTPTQPHDDTYTLGDVHLLPGSPCINTGDPNFVPAAGETDIDGDPRVLGCRTDMGVDEAPYQGGDFDDDGQIDLDDVGPFVDALLAGGANCMADVNQDGFVNGA
ncbi:MAG TPA: right-handed parallel beta-helix repeat-containing protein, partial [Phycisphaerae bacterium]|nr:right-handed parallel beta-helix repeat-containing protein [Phycisphaerae bacterium]